MAKSMVQLLRADAATVPRAASTGRHHHAFWQLDHCDGDPMVCALTDTRLHLRRGQGVLLPPGVSHDFCYRAGSRYVSWKFTWDGPAPITAVKLADQPGWTGLAAALVASPAVAAVPHLLAAAIALTESPATETGLTAEVARLVDADPARAWSVVEVAQRFSLSSGHASARFRAECGMTLKRWLDVRRAEYAGRALTGSDLSLALVAERCGFSDQFAFSRFFHRITGESPSAFRQRHG